MGYRSKVIIGVEKQHSKKLEKIFKKHQYTNVFIEDTERKRYHKEQKNWKYYIGDYLKWYDEYDEVREINQFIEDIYGNINDSAFIVCLGEDNHICHETGEWYYHVDHFSDIDICKMVKQDKDKQDKEKQDKQLEWFNHFVDFIGNIDSNIYNEACEYADNCENS